MLEPRRSAWPPKTASCTHGRPFLGNPYLVWIFPNLGPHATETPGRGEEQPVSTCEQRERRGENRRAKTAYNAIDIWGGMWGIVDGSSVTGL